MNMIASTAIIAMVIARVYMMKKPLLTLALILAFTMLSPLTIIAQTPFADTQAAAIKGDDKAQNQLAEFYYQGNHVEVNYPEAAKWWRKSAKQGNLLAQYYLGNMYYEGEGVVQNYTTAYALLLLAKAGGYKLATGSIEKLLQDGIVPMQIMRRARYCHLVL